MKTPEELIAEFEKQQDELNAELEKLGIPSLDDDKVYDAEAEIEGYPPILRATVQSPPDELIETVGALLEAGEDPNAASPYGETAVSHCFANGTFAAMRFLIENGADTSEFLWSNTHRQVALGQTPDPTDLLVRDSAGRTPFLLACRIGNEAAGKFLFHLTPSEGHVGTDGEKPVIIAARSHSPKMVAWALEKGFDVNARAEFGATALLRAVESDDVETAELLLKAGADLSLAKNISASLEADKAKSRSKTSIFSKAADAIMARMPGMPDMTETLSTPASAAHSAPMARLLMAHGADILEFDSEMQPSATGADCLSEVAVSVDDFNQNSTVRAGRSNPEAYLPNFWREQIRTGRSGYAATVDIVGERSYDTATEPVWSFDRFGLTATALPHGRMVLIAGEHEDGYDPDFCIYADVTVLDGNGSVAHFIYPEDVFPPTDFHTATLADDYILLIGSLGYQGNRPAGVTQVLRLNLDDFSIQPVKTTGANPGWINRHTSRLEGSSVIVTGGKIEPGYVDNIDTFILDLETRVWSRAS